MRYEKLEEFMYQPLVEGDHHDPVPLSHLHAAIGCRVPPDFAEFLERYPDTGNFEVEGVVFVASDDKLSGRHDGRFAVETLFAACTDQRYDLLNLWRQDKADGFAPIGCMRIGDDSFGKAFFLDLRDKSFGKIYFWDHEHAKDESGLHLVRKASLLSCSAFN